MHSTSRTVTEGDNWTDAKLDHPERGARVARKEAKQVHAYNRRSGTHDRTKLQLYKPLDAVT
eukprot:5551241-Alexandrium_andersonii.AAC.1